MTNLISRTRAAAVCGVSPQAIDKALKAGRISYADPAKRLFDPVALEAQWHGNRRRQRAAKAAAAPDVQAPAEGQIDPIPRLLHRKLSAETALAEQKAKVGSGARIAVDELGRALFLFYTLGRGTLDAAHPRLLDQLDAFCPMGDPRYPALADGSYALFRGAWADIWALLAQCLGDGQPEMRRWFVEFAVRERGTNPRAAPPQ
jgi:hypothetical protein